MFYKTSNPAVLDAFHALNQQRADLYQGAENFAKEFNAEPVILKCVGDLHFAGIKFKDKSKVNFDVWCKPNRSFGHSNLRVRALKKEHQAEWKKESEKHKSLYEKYFPNGDRVSSNPFYQSLGFDWGNLLFSAFGCFELDGTLYMDTSINLKEVTEILGSEYKAAELNLREAEKQGE